MANETIMLAKTYKKQKPWPAVVTEKLDGVAIDLYVPSDHDGGILARTRQDEPYFSVEHIQRWLKDKLKPGDHLICELYIPGKPFKEISGMSRRENAEPELIAFIYDFYNEQRTDTPYVERMKIMAQQVACHCRLDTPVQIIGGTYCETEDDFKKFMENFVANRPTAEGVVIRKLEGDGTEYKPAWRSPGMLKHKVTETADLKVVGFEEATSEEGEPKGMVGRIMLEYKGQVIGAGPGKLTHPERIDVFNNPNKYIGKIAEIAYMPDPSYDALREPRFWRWRDDKDTPNEE